MDKLTICKRCGSDACYSQEVNDSITNYQCMGCGFVSNSLMKPNSDFLNEQSEVLPELYKDLFFEDKDGYIWMPSTVNIPKFAQQVQLKLPDLGIKTNKLELPKLK